MTENKFIKDYPNRIEIVYAKGFGKNLPTTFIYGAEDLDSGYAITPSITFGASETFVSFKMKDRNGIWNLAIDPKWHISNALKIEKMDLYFNNKLLTTIDQHHKLGLCEVCANHLACRVSGSPAVAKVSRLDTVYMAGLENNTVECSGNFIISKQHYIAKQFDLKLSDEKFVNRFLSYFSDVPIADIWALHTKIMKGDTITAAKIMVIPKKNHKHRVVCAPSAKMKKILSVLYKNFLMPLEIGEEYADTVTAFRQDSGIAFNGMKHAGKDILISVDLSNFFHSVDYKMVRIFLEKYYSSAASHHLANLMTLKMPESVYKLRGCFNGKRKVCPQGYPTSPAMANLIGFDLLDTPVMPKIISWIKENLNGAEITYTRYADDVTVSFNTTRENLKEAGEQAAHKLCEFIKTLTPFIINERKIKVMPRTVRQYCCGVVVNEKINIMRSRYKKDRAMVDYYYKGRLPFSSYREIMGRISFGSSIAPLKYAPLKQKLEGARQLRIDKYKESDEYNANS